MSEHAIYSPSSADRWLKCPGSVPMTETLHSTESEHNEYTASGTVIHAIGEAMFYDLWREDRVKWGDWADVGPFNDELVTKDMVKQADDYTEACIDLAISGDEWLIEEKAYFNEHLFGTADCVLVNNDCVTVIDLKTGTGNMVSPIDNKQLMTYAGMVISKMDDIPHKVRLVIVQPPDERDPVKIWDTDSSVIMRHMIEVGVAMDSDHLEAGSHCKWCPCRASCTVIHSMAVNAASLSLDGLSPVQWAEALHLAEVLKPWCGAVEARANQLAVEEGLSVPGYKLVEKKGRKTWKSEVSAGYELSAYIEDADIDIFNKAKLRTPTQLVKELKGHVDESVINELSVVPDKGLMLVKDSDKREAVESGANLIKAAEQLELFS